MIKFSCIVTTVTHLIEDIPLKRMRLNAFSIEQMLNCVADSVDNKCGSLVQEHRSFNTL